MGTETERPRQRVRLKFCGGCNPDYDRLEVAEEIKKMVVAADDMALCTDNDPDVVIAICGCPTACADVERFTGARIVTVTRPQEIEKIRIGVFRG